VAAKDDPLTPHYSDLYTGWSQVCQSVTLVELSEGGHYFCRTRPDETASVVNELIR
jgi:hypothetical protein